MSILSFFNPFRHIRRWGSRFSYQPEKQSPQAHKKDKTKIARVIVMGDSLSDRGTMFRRRLFGIIPMKGIAGLSGRSPRGRFTNGFRWSDDLAADAADECEIGTLEHPLAGPRYDMDCTDIADAAIAHDAVVNPLLSHRKVKPLPATPHKKILPSQTSQKSFSFKKKAGPLYNMDATDIADAVSNSDPNAAFLKDAYNLDDDKAVRFDGNPFFESYAEGGLTAHNYAGAPSFSATRFFSRLMLSTLGAQRKKLLEDDQKRYISDEEKAQSLVIEWSGANDLITVNKHPSKEEADKAIQARIVNATQLAKNGYKNFVLFNLPNLGLTPRYRRLGGDAQRNATDCSDYFNLKLQAACEQWNEQQLAIARAEWAKGNAAYVPCTMRIFDAHQKFQEIYDDPEKYGFNKDLLTEPYLESDLFKKNKKDKTEQANKTSPAPGYAFWDDVHPSATMDEWVCKELENTILQPHYQFLHPTFKSADALRTLFKKAYDDQLEKDREGCFGWLSHSRLNMDYIDNQDVQSALTYIFRHALKNKGHRTHKVLEDLGWIDQHGKLVLQHEALQTAMHQIDRENLPKETKKTNPLSPLGERPQQSCG